MNKLVKGAVATGLGVALLMGGAGTLAFWNASTPLAAASGGSITAGQLSASAGAAGTWNYGTSAGPAVNLSTFKIVPGDTIVYTQNVTLTASGDNLKFSIGSTGAGITATGAAANTALATALGNGAVVTYTVTSGTGSLTSLGSGQYKVATAGTTTVAVTVTVTWPFGASADNAAQTGVATLATSSLAFTQIP
ncbi:MAG TPA: alternate-type signal peptide domain-containing protein [Pseudolysinimonas sp.]|nr:alternate-type signal peptide domain-containing protein [Pseudolysinimonas sp.]